MGQGCTHMVQCILVHGQALRALLATGSCYSSALYSLVKLHERVHVWPQQPAACITEVPDGQGCCWRGILMCQPCR